MSSFESYSTGTTNISYQWPSEVTGLERIALSARGDLQRVLSAYLSRTISIGLVYSHTFRQSTVGSPPVPLVLPNPTVLASASPEAPITQTRQVHLQCEGKIAVTATSTVRLTSPEVARLFLEDKYPIGQMFRKLEQKANFELVAAGTGPVEKNEKYDSLYQPDGKAASWDSADTSKQLWRKYRLFVPYFECDILEVFPNRDMLVDGDAWVTGQPSKKVTTVAPAPEKEYDINFSLRLSSVQQSAALVAFIALLLVLSFEGSLRYFSNTSSP